MTSAVSVPNERIPEHAERLVSRRVGRDDLALSFSESRASSAEVLVAGESFYPRMLDDIRAASSSVHVNQFGFRPGLVGDAFADALISKAAEGVPVRLVVDRRGSDPERGARAHYERLVSGGVQVWVVRAMQVRTQGGRLGGDGANGWNLGALGHIDHRKLTVVDGRIGWVGGAGIEDHFRDGRFHDLFVRVTGPVVAQIQLVFLASVRWLGGEVRLTALEALFPVLEAGGEALPARVLHNAPGRFRPITSELARLFEQATDTLDVVNPYVTDREMIQRIAQAAERGVRVRLFVPAKVNKSRLGLALQHYHTRLLDGGVRIIEHPAMLHAKAFVRDGEEVIVGTCNLEAWSLRRFFEVDLQLWSGDVAAQFEERFSAPAEAVSRPGQPLVGTTRRLKATASATLSRLL